MSRSEAFRWEDMKSSERAGTQRELSKIGKSTASNVPSAIRAYKETAEKETNNPETRKKAAARAATLETISDSFVDRPISISGATSRRKGYFSDSIGSARESGAAGPIGFDWFFKHADEVKEASEEFDFDAAAAASAALSPGKDPKADELPALRALSELHRGDHTISIDGGEPMAVRSLSPVQLAKYLSKAAKEGNAAEPKVTSSYEGFRAGGRAHEGSTARAVAGLRGDVPPGRVNNPVSGPKTWSYEHLIRQAGNATPEERLDFMNIGHHLVHGDENQGMFIFSKAEPGEYEQNDLFSSQGHTPEDTWMQAITSGQPIQTTVNGKSYSPAKRAVDKGGPGEMQINKEPANLRVEMKPESAVHAFSNKATRQAAEETQSGTFNQFGEEIGVPSAMLHPAAWTMARREAGGDAPFNAQQRKEQKASISAEKAAERAKKQAEKRRNSPSYKVKDGDQTYVVSQMFVGDDLKINKAALPPKK